MDKDIHSSTFDKNYIERNKNKLSSLVYSHLTGDLENVTLNSVVDLKHYRKSPNVGADATKPKIQLITPSGPIYFKFGLTENEVCAEIISYYLATTLDIRAAKTALAWYKDSLGIASWSIGEYVEPDDDKSYSIPDFLHLDGFFEMCLFDYLVMNEDRHAGNWCIQNNSVAPLFDHNVCFGGEEIPIDYDNFMVKLTSPFDIGAEYHQQQDKILELLLELDKAKVKAFLAKVQKITSLELPALEKLFPKQFNLVSKLFRARVLYMTRKVAEYEHR